MIHRTKATLLVTVAATGGMMLFSCGLADLRNSAVAGMQAFVTGYVADILTAVVPPAGTLLGGGGA